MFHGCRFPASSGLSPIAIQMFWQLISFLDLNFNWVNILWIITGKKKRRRVVATPQCIVLTDLSISYHYNEHIALYNPGSILCWLSVQVWLCSLNISWFFLVYGCKCKDFFLISNTFRQLFFCRKSLISKDIKFFPEAPFPVVSIVITTLFRIIAQFRVKVSKSRF